jgi:hypothetical protein
MTDPSNPEYRAEVKRLMQAGYPKAHSEQAARRALGIPEPSSAVVHQQVSTTGPKPDITVAKQDRPTSAEVRAWAREQGIDVPARGRIPASVIQRYQER